MSWHTLLARHHLSPGEQQVPWPGTTAAPWVPMSWGSVEFLFFWGGFFFFFRHPQFSPSCHRIL